MSIKLLDTIYKLTDNADKVDGKHASDFATSGHTHSYLPLSGGTIAGTLNIKRDAAAICYQNSSGTTLGWLGITSSGVGTLWESDGSTKRTLLHSGNSSVSLSGSTLTVKINGTTQSLTNTNTTYSAGTGLSLSGTTFSNSGVRSISTGSANGTISVNTNGTSADVAVKGLGSAAYTASTAYATANHSHSGYLPRLRMTNPDPGHASIGAIPYIFALKAVGTPVYGDPEFKDGVNSVGYYNNSGGGTVTVTRISDNQNSANSSGYILQISSTTGTTSPGRGGFVQNITSRAGAVFCQIFRAKIPTGFTVVNAENSMGSNYKTYWLTDRAGTGKWEWYCRITICGTSGTFSGGGHVYLSADAGGNPAVTWYLSYCNLIDLTKANYDGLRSVYAEKLDSSAGSATNPVYFSGGKPVACTYSLNKTVPSDAKFTDTNTTYSAGTGLSLSGTTFNHASSVTAGTAGTSSATSGSAPAIPYVTVNATGHVTGYGTHTHTINKVKDIGNSTDTSFAYSKAGLNYADYTWLAGWNGYELRAVNKSQFAQASHTHSYAGSSSAGGSATTAVSLYTGSASGSSHANALQTYFNSNKSNIPRNKTISFYSSAYSNGSQYTGYFLSGYDSTPYGGFFCAHYDNCYYVGISYGTFNEQRILTSSNWSSYCAAASHTHSYASSSHNHDSVYSKLGHTHSYAASSHTHTKSQITDFAHTHDYAASNHTHSYAASNHSHTYYWANVSVSTSSSTTTSPTFSSMTCTSSARCAYLIVEGSTSTNLSSKTTSTYGVAGYFANTSVTSTSDSYATVKAVTAGSSYVGFYTNGKCRYASASSTSDRRLKKDIKYFKTEYSDDFIKKIDKIDFASFRYNDNNGNSLLYGFIAQDVQNYFPEIVDSSNEYLCLDYNSCFVLKIASLERKIKILEEKLKEVNILF